MGEITGQGRLRLTDVSLTAWTVVDNHGLNGRNRSPDLRQNDQSGLDGLCGGRSPNYGSRGCRFESCRARVWLRQQQGSSRRGRPLLVCVSVRFVGFLPVSPFGARVPDAVRHGR